MTVRNQSSLATTMSGLIPDNSSQAITAANVRSILTDFIDTWGNPVAGIQPGWLNVKTDLKKLGFPANATGDFLSDDSDALQNAIDYATNHDDTNREKLSTIYIPPGVYKITKTLELKKSGFGAGMRIMGGGSLTRDKLGNALNKNNNATYLVWSSSQATGVNAMRGPILYINTYNSLILDGLNFWGYNSDTTSSEAQRDDSSAASGEIEMGVWHRAEEGGVLSGQHVFRNCSFHLFERAFDNRAQDSEAGTANLFFDSCWFGQNDLCFTSWHAGGLLYTFLNCVFNNSKIAFWFLQGGQLRAIACYGAFLNKVLHIEEGSNNISGNYIHHWKFDGSGQSLRGVMYSESRRKRQLLDFGHKFNETGAAGTSDGPTLVETNTMGDSYGQVRFEGITYSSQQDDVHGIVGNIEETTGYALDHTGSGKCVLTVNLRDDGDRKFRYYASKAGHLESGQSPLGYGQEIKISGAVESSYNGNHRVQVIREGFNGVTSVTATLPFHLSFDGTTRQITRDSGDWVADGFITGCWIQINSTGSSTNDGPWLVTGVDTGTLETADADYTDYKIDGSSDMLTENNILLDGGSERVRASYVKIETDIPFVSEEVPATGVGWISATPLFDLYGGSKLSLRDSQFPESLGDQQTIFRMENSGGTLRCHLLVDHVSSLATDAIVAGQQTISGAYLENRGGPLENFWVFRDCPHNGASGFYNETNVPFHYIAQTQY